ncbi:hypothetical protein PINS_up010328 [Pythium insidiosum]|nr:hypothetical protein PINS_up010328 [Pythium insidiosum]
MDSTRIMETVAVADWRSIVAPWLHPSITAFLEPFPLDDDEDAEGDARLGVCRFPDYFLRRMGESESLRSVREVIELLHIVACVDLTAWRTLLGEALGHEAPHKLDSRRLVPRYVVAPHEERSSGALAELGRLRELLISLGQDEMRTPAFRSARDQLQRLAASMCMDGQNDVDRLKIDVRLRPAPSSPMVRWQLQSYMVHLRDLLQQIPNQATMPLPRFEINAIDIRLDEALLDTMTILILHSFVSTGIRVTGLSLNSQIADNPVARNAWQALCRSAVPRLRRVCADLYGGDETHAAILCSALACSTSVISTDVELWVSSSAPFRERQMIMSWLGLAIFRLGSSRFLKLSGREMTTDDVNAIRVMLMPEISTFPLLLASERHVRGEPTAVQAMKSIQTFSVPSAEAQSPPSVVLNEGERFIVIDNVGSTTQWIPAIVSGHGVLWISARDREAIKLEHAASNSPLKSLVLKFENPSHLGATHDALIELIEAVGSSIQSLQLQIANTVLLRRDLVRVLSACPRLRNLSVRGLHLDSIDPLLQRQPHSFASLHLGQIRLPNAALAELFEALSDPTTAIYRDLSTLRIDLCAIEGLTDDTVAKIEPMLRSNTRLRRVAVVLPFLFMAHANAISACDNSAIASEARPLPLRQRLALLSVVRADLESTQALRHVGNDPILRIFEFAAECESRIVLCDVF